METIRLREEISTGEYSNARKASITETIEKIEACNSSGHRFTCGLWGCCPRCGLRRKKRIAEETNLDFLSRRSKSGTKVWQRGWVTVANSDFDRLSTEDFNVRVPLFLQAADGMWKRFGTKGSGLIYSVELSDHGALHAHFVIYSDGISKEQFEHFLENHGLGLEGSKIKDFDKRNTIDYIKYQIRYICKPAHELLLKKKARISPQRLAKYAIGVKGRKLLKRYGVFLKRKESVKTERVEDKGKQAGRWIRFPSEIAYRGIPRLESLRPQGRAGRRIEGNISFHNRQKNSSP